MEDKEPSTKEILTQMIEEALELNRSGHNEICNEILKEVLIRLTLLKE